MIMYKSLSPRRWEGMSLLATRLRSLIFWISSRLLRLMRPLVFILWYTDRRGTGFVGWFTRSQP